MVAGVTLRGEVSGDTQEDSSEEVGLVDGVGVGVGEWKGLALECVLFKLPQEENKGRMVVEMVGAKPQDRRGQGRVEKAEGHVKDRWLSISARWGGERTLPKAGQGWVGWRGHCILLVYDITRVC